MGRRLIYLVLAFFATPGQWQCFTPFQSKGKIGPQSSLFQSSTAYLFLTLILTLKCLHPTEYSQSMSSTIFPLLWNGVKHCHCPGVAKKANTRYMSRRPLLGKLLKYLVLAFFATPGQ
jgi:hypothetical protein